jgi:hypothetical protein
MWTCIPPTRHREGGKLEESVQQCSLDDQQAEHVSATLSTEVEATVTEAEATVGLEEVGLEEVGLEEVRKVEVGL